MDRTFRSVAGLSFSAHRLTVSTLMQSLLAFCLRPLIFHGDRLESYGLRFIISRLRKRCKMQAVQIETYPMIAPALAPAVLTITS